MSGQLLSRSRSTTGTNAQFAVTRPLTVTAIVAPAAVAGHTTGNRGHVSGVVDVATGGIVSGNLAGEGSGRACARRQFRREGTVEAAVAFVGDRDASELHVATIRDGHLVGDLVTHARAVHTDRAALGDLVRLERIERAPGRRGARHR